MDEDGPAVQFAPFSRPSSAGTCVSFSAQRIPSKCNLRCASLGITPFRLVETRRPTLAGGRAGGNAPPPKKATTEHGEKSVKTHVVTRHADPPLDRFAVLVKDHQAGLVGVDALVAVDVATAIPLV